MKSIFSKQFNLIVLATAFIFLHFSSEIYSQKKDDILAKAGSVSITKDEFIKRFELTPHPDREALFDSALTKKRFLLTLLAEKLLAQQAVIEGLEKSPEFITSMNYMRNLYLRDAIYQKEVKDKINIPDSEYVKAKKKITKTLNAKFIFSTEENEINDIYRILIEHASFDSLLTLRPENKEQPEVAEIDFGKMNEIVEDLIFDLKPGEITKPVKLPEGWYIFKVYSVVNKNLFEESDLKKVERIITEREENKTYEKFYKMFFKNIVVNADRKLFEQLSEKIVDYIDSNKMNLILRNNKYALYDKDIYSIKNYFNSDTLDLIFIKFNPNPVTLNSFLEFMAMDGFEFADASRIKSRLNTYISTYIQNEILAREALKRGYDKLPSVDYDLAIWKENYLSNLIMKKYYKEEFVTDEEAYEFYAKNNKLIPQSDEIKIVEILTDNLDDIQKIFTELEKGTDFIELVKKYTIRDTLKIKGGEFDFQPVDKPGEIWEAASKLKIGEVFGPIKSPEGYSVIKLIDRRARKKLLFDSFEEAKNSIIEILKTNKMYNKLEEITSKLALDYGLEINDKMLNLIKVNNINMIVYRRFGFGGQQLAVPYTQNFSSWYEKYEQMKKSLSF